jgi:hypothetical protein
MGGHRGPRGTGPLAVLATLLVAGLALAGCSDDGGRELPPEWRGRDLAEPGWANGTIRPGWALGVEYVWSSGTAVEWDWLLDGPGVLHFKVVRMQDGKAQPMVSHFANESAAGLTVPQAGAYHILWRNEGFPEQTLWYKVPEGHSGPRLYTASDGPDCTVLLAAGYAC